MFALSQCIIKISARSLKSSLISNAHYNTRCNVFIKNGSDSDFIQLDNTEINADCISPDWNKQFMIAYKFHEIQTLRFDIYRCLKNGNEQRKIGESKITFAELVTAKDGFTMKSVKNDNQKVGKLLITIKEVQTTKEAVIMQFSGKNLDKLDMFGLSDPYLVISKINENGNPVEVYRTETIKSSISPIWSEIKLRVKTLTDYNFEKQLQFNCHDWDRNKEDDLIGCFNTTFEKLLKGPIDENNYEIINPNKLVQHLNTYKNSGIISLDSIRIIEEESFMDYLRKGSQFHFRIALDFTSLIEYENMNSDQNNNKQNMYKLIIRRIGSILSQYDTEGLMSGSGFGAVFPDQESTDYYEILKDYKYFNNIEDFIEKCELLMRSVKPLSKREQSSKSISFEPTITHTIEWIDEVMKNESNNKFDYFILLIMTSDVNCEMLNSLENIISKTYPKPLSIVMIDNNSDNSCEEIEDVIDGMGQENKISSRNNIKYISTVNYLNTKQTDDLNKLVNKLFRDILNQIPDQYFDYLQLMPK